VNNQGELWSADPDGWARRAESRLVALYDAVLELVAPLAGTRLLDAGCGAGLFASLAVERGAEVHGLDVAPALVEYARRRVPGAAEFVVGDICALPFADREFHAVIALNSLLYASDPSQALAELARVTAPSGSVVLTWGCGPEQATCAELLDALRTTVPAAERTPHQTSLTLSDDRRRSAAMATAGLDEVERRDVAFAWTFRDLDDAVGAQLPAGPVVDVSRQVGLDEVCRALEEFFTPRVRADGSVLMNVIFRCVVARPRV
jgi:ubiquinone/menaquinone biosynthesis C-methylase UbiE